MSIGLAAFLLFSAFMVLLFVGVPISICIAISSICAALPSLEWDQITYLVMQKMNGGIESFSLLAVPLFILAGNIMNNGGIANLLIDFAKLFVGKIPGALAQTNVLGNMFFGALAGSAVAASAAIGGTLAPIEKKEGYDMGFATAVNIASAPTGLLIPPTSAFIVYSAVVGGVSIAALFMAGYLPGILMGLSTSVLAWLYARKHKYPVSKGVDFKTAMVITLRALPSLFLIIVVIGGIVGGIFTATEGAGVCVVYCLILAICYKAINLHSFMKILLDSACVSGIVLFLISCSSAMSYVMALSGIPAAISQAILGVTNNPIIILLLINVILLIVGTFMDITPAILIFTPIFLPIAKSLGMTEVQFGVLLIFNMCLGCMTPPVGSVLFVSCGVTGISIEKVIKPLLPFVAMLFIILLLITYVPWISIGIPTMMGLM